MRSRRKWTITWRSLLSLGLIGLAGSCKTVECKIPPMREIPTEAVLEYPQVAACCQHSADRLAYCEHYREGIEILREADGDVSIDLPGGD